MTINYAHMSTDDWSYIQGMIKLLQKIADNQQRMPLPFPDKPEYQQIGMMTDLLRYNYTGTLGQMYQDLYNVAIKQNWIIGVHARNFSRQARRHGDER